jgi:hypothetical protein
MNLNLPLALEVMAETFMTSPFDSAQVPPSFAVLGLPASHLVQRLVAIRLNTRGPVCHHERLTVFGGGPREGSYIPPCETWSAPRRIRLAGTDDSWSGPL